MSYERESESRVGLRSPRIGCSVNKHDEFNRKRFSQNRANVLNARTPRITNIDEVYEDVRKKTRDFAWSVTSAQVLAVPPFDDSVSPHMRCLQGQRLG
jgi:hypothetical protein